MRQLVMALLLTAVPLSRAEIPPLPEPVTNNAVASVQLDDGLHLVSLMGLGSGKTWQDTTLAAWHLAPAAASWRRLPDVPGDEGRLAGVAVGVGEHIYIVGGYTVAADHAEVSVPSVHALDLQSKSYTEKTPMPVPVDDTVALVYRDRYIYLVSGWHDSGNVNLVQLYDTETDSWTQATPWPATPVFGAAGGIVDDTIVICDGVAVRSTRDQRRFVSAPTCRRGVIRADDIRRIDWYSMPHHPGPALYRMAATGARVGDGSVILFAGGSANPYNYDGVGYNGRPSDPSDRVFAWSVQGQRWLRLRRLQQATMDHRGLLPLGQGYAIVGGMRDEQQVTDDVVVFEAVR
ncbi:MAG: galactose oxidase [Gammaproteobacteria bacterium]|nr:galactose oxidase [Gammaproteobacteria bacterium]